MKVRTKLTLTLLGLTLFPFFTVGRIVYQRGEEALRQSLGQSLERMAAETIDKVDRRMFEVQTDVRTWARLEVMQEVLTKDLDGRIASFLIGINSEYQDFLSVQTIDRTGEIVASSDVKEVGTRTRAGALDASRARSLQDVHRDLETGAWVAVFCRPIPAQFDDSQVIGTVCARWNANELGTMTQAIPETSDAGHPETILIRNDGVVISAPPGNAPLSEGDNLLVQGWESALAATRGARGHLVETIPGAGEYLVGYSPSVGYRDFTSMGWAALVVRDIESAFAPVYDLEYVVLLGGSIVAVVVVGLSFIMSHHIAGPAVKMAEVATRVAEGDFEARVDYRSTDEIGTFARVFDEMIGELKRKRARLEEELAARKQHEIELRKSKDLAEESTAKFKAVLDTMSEGVVTVDESGTLLLVNEEVQRIWGYDACELPGKSGRILLPESERHRYRPEFERFVRDDYRGPSKARFETRGIRKDGSTFPMEVSAAKTRIGGKVLVIAALRDITARRRSEDRINAALHEKEVLLKEIHHRVKNNLQVIVSLLRLQSEHIKDETARSVFLDSESRVKSMALMHEKLYRSKDLSRIQVVDYIEALTTELSRSYRATSAGVTLRLHIEDLTLGIDTAIHCGLLVNELVSNAFKHAFPGDRTGEVVVELERESGGTYRLEVRDDGVGLPEGTDTASTDTLGLNLTHTLVEQLDGTMTVDRRHGTSFTILFHDIDDVRSA